MGNNDRIEVLPQSVVEKIAAGEIIERPASILKELIENSIDAGAGKIDISIEDAGFSSIRVTDNGRGMSTEDLRKSVARHATSKIRSIDDLSTLQTMGFRGEALASIGAVSRLTIASSDTDNGLGYSLQCDGGEIGAVTPVSLTKGTMILSRDLFFNVPARKKFMKTRRAEYMALARCIEHLSIPFASIHFTAAFDGKRILEAPAVESANLRISQIAGNQFAHDLIRCTGARDGMEAIVYVSAPHNAQIKPRFQNLYVNRRKVENDQVLFAVREAFSQFTKSSFKPSFFCFLDVDPSRIDINVHPSKLKVKFEDERKLFGFIFDTLRRGIADVQPSRPDIFLQQPAQQELPDHLTIEGVASFVQGNCTVAEMHRSQQESVQSLAADRNPQTLLSFPQQADQKKKDLDPSDDNKIQLTESEKSEPWNLIPCYQIHAMFILAQIKNGILLLDQHAAHERILFEQVLNDYQRGRCDSQQLLFPIVFELTPAEKEIALKGSAFFSASGFDIHDFGGNSVSVSSLPAFMKDSNAEPALREMLRYLLDEKSESDRDDTAKRFAAAFACGAAIKAGQKLSQEEMNVLLNNLFGTENPYICPHGRPTLIRMSLDELARRFLR